jgi:hypothetical protein
LHNSCNIRNASGRTSVEYLKSLAETKGTVLSFPVIRERVLSEGESSREKKK